MDHIPIVFCVGFFFFFNFITRKVPRAEFRRILRVYRKNVANRAARILLVATLHCCYRYPVVIGTHTETLAALHKRNVGDTLSIACPVF